MTAAAVDGVGVGNEDDDGEVIVLMDEDDDDDDDEGEEGEEEGDEEEEEEGEEDADQGGDPPVQEGQQQAGRQRQGMHVGRQRAPRDGTVTKRPKLLSLRSERTSSASVRRTNEDTNTLHADASASTRKGEGKVRSSKEGKSGGGALSPSLKQTLRKLLPSANKTGTPSTPPPPPSATATVASTKTVTSTKTTPPRSRHRFSQQRRASASRTTSSSSTSSSASSSAAPRRKASATSPVALPKKTTAVKAKVSVMHLLQKSSSHTVRMVTCPCCEQQLSETVINTHLDQCLPQRSKSAPSKAVVQHHTASISWVNLTLENRHFSSNKPNNNGNKDNGDNEGCASDHNDVVNDSTAEQRERKQSAQSKRRQSGIALFDADSDSSTDDDDDDCCADDDDGGDDDGDDDDDDGFGSGGGHHACTDDGQGPRASGVTRQHVTSARAASASISMDTEAPAAESEDAKHQRCFTCGALDHWSRECPQGPYYLRHFKLMVDEVSSATHNRHLLCPHDVAVLRCLNALPMPAQKLFVRLYNRRHAWLRVDRLSYPEIAEDLNPVVSDLVECGLAHTPAAVTSLSDALHALSPPSLRTLQRQFRVRSSSTTREDLVRALTVAAQQQRTLLSKDSSTRMRKAAVALMGNCVRLNADVRALFTRLEVLFFMKTGLRENTLATVYLAEKGALTYPSYRVRASATPVFSSRRQLLEYTRALVTEQRLEDAIMSGRMDDVEADLKHAYAIWRQLVQNAQEQALREKEKQFRLQFTPAWVYTRIVCYYVELLERNHDYEPAVVVLHELLEQKLFCLDRRGRWFDRIALHYSEHVRDAAESLRLCDEGVRDHHIRTGHKLSLLRRAARLCRSSKHPHLHRHAETHPPAQLHAGQRLVLYGRAMSDREPGRKMTFIHNDTLCSVEDFVLLKFAERNWKGIHCEGQFFRTVFALLMWDVMFADVPHAFQTRYQVAPADFHTDTFYAARYELIKKRLGDIYDGDLHSMIMQAWDEHHGVMAAGLSWNMLSRDELAEATAAIGNKVIAGVCDILAQDYRHRSGGLPDLLLWKQQPTGERLATFVEVKSPNDTLAEKQKIWIHVLVTLGANVALCEVRDYAGRAELLKRPVSPLQA
ncbi:hypothetical protein PTSG_01097 [Salpingoeca rosetta]|uniref:Fanconi-associated nuclease n=1 Tax=Salpingoeca rosetta (strain ATCC 50818 / BSB-021) TaxID=946362 RepID=F2U0T2_SALR5|nr:uncharacterized protein PTSG_01097 [Salpingoeca rosetta]EGD80506.1 hypothetical protein PTSG_01097 [Salpingoeca rosetta]|eukprot:XP_004997067.1 hypothetical protein PTSG_01097 [Salpingoeca rosetta]